MIFEYPWALFLLAFLIPLIILYLLRPKPKDIKIPSLMFIMQFDEKRRFNSLFKRIIRDPLLLLQMIIIIFLVLMIANPIFLGDQHATVGGEVAIILDVSASMQADGRFEEARERLSDLVASLGTDSKTSLIVSKSIPVVLVRGGSPSEISTLIEHIDTADSPGTLGNAMNLGIDMIKNSESKKSIFVISDFSHQEGADISAIAKKSIRDNIGTGFIEIGDARDNIGIISAESLREGGACLLNAVVKNFGEEDGKMSMTFYIDDVLVHIEEGEIGAGQSRLFNFNGACDLSEHILSAVLETNIENSLPVDDKIYRIVPKSLDLDVLLIKDDDEDYVRYALEAIPGIKLKEATPPIFPQDYSAFDIVVFQSADIQNILGGTFAELLRYVRGGGRLVILGFEDIGEIDDASLDELLPVKIESVSTSSGVSDSPPEHRLFLDVSIDDSQLNKYIEATADESAAILLKKGQRPLMASQAVSGGEVLYIGFGMSDEWTDFHLSTSFPLFWNNVAHWMKRDETAEGVYNFKTGERATNGTGVRHKDSGAGANQGILEWAGVYDDGSHYISANLLDEKESDVTYKTDIPSPADGESAWRDKGKKEYELFFVLAAFAVLLLLWEWAYYKRRGSIS